ncbi:MAG: ATP-binding cassette domain-containing protein [Chloroflexota bacterium]|nr:ATP-binding cassette domain-containing protein [Chloroflexota bacterium]
MLHVERLTKTFHVDHLGRDIPAFAPIDFQLAPGQFALISGANGAGKSSLLRCLYRTYKPSGGSAHYAAHAGTIDLATAADVDIALLRREELSFVTQFLRSRPRVSALEWVAEPLLNAGHAWDAAVESAGTMLDALGLKRALWSAYPSTFSGGEQQKVNLARALVYPRRLLLLDEPTASLDAAARASLAERLAAIKDAGVAMIGVFHYPQEVMHLVDHEVRLEGMTNDVAA